MKKTPILLAAAVIAVLLVVLIAAPVNNDVKYLRIHIRANSNSDSDQNVKYLVKDAVTAYTEPLVKHCKSFEAAYEIIEDHLSAISAEAEKALLKKGYSYGARARLAYEQFPARAYGETVLDSGFYDALIIELGTGTGDNWWCVIYPPLCFFGEGEGEIEYRSIIADWFK